MFGVLIKHYFLRGKSIKETEEKLVIVYYVPRRIMRVITRRVTMLAVDRSRGAISPASILNESRNYSNCVHWHIFYFMWLRRIYEFLCVHSNPVWKGWNCRDYRPSYLTFCEYFRPFWLSQSYIVAAYCNRRMCSSNVQGFVTTVPTVYEEEDYAPLYRNRRIRILLSGVWWKLLFPGHKEAWVRYNKCIQLKWEYVEK